MVYILIESGRFPLRVISVRHARYEAINFLASLFQIADLNLSLTFYQTCLLSQRKTNNVTISHDVPDVGVLIQAGP